MANWPRTPIKELGEVFDGPHATPQTIDKGPLFLGISSLDKGRIRLSETRHVTDDDFIKWTRRVEPQANDFVFSYETKIGEAALIPEGMRCCLGRRMGLVRLDTSRVDPRFFLYVYLSPDFQEFLRSKTINGATVDRLSLKEFGDFPFPCPKLSIQRAIATMLGALDDKIELNRRMNKTMEAMARAIFKSWFVNFDPVYAKMEGRETGLAADVAALFPERFGDSGLPEGWETRKIGELPVRIAMGPFGSRIKTDNFAAIGVPVIRGGNLTDGFVDDDFVYITPEKAEELRSAAAFPGDIVITHRGTLGQVGKIPSGSRFEKYIVSQSQMLLGSNTEYLSLHYLFEFLRSAAGVNALLSNTTTTGVPAIGRPSTSLRAIELLYPPEFILVEFDKIMQKLEARQVAGKMESETLAALRNVLLPKLMSGDVRIRDAEKLIGEARG